MLSSLSISFSSRVKSIRETARGSGHGIPNRRLIGLSLNTATATVLRKTPTPTKPLHNMIAIGNIHPMTCPRIIGQLPCHRDFQILRFPPTGLPRHRRPVLGTGPILCHPRYPCRFLYTLLYRTSLLFLKHHIRQPATISSVICHPTSRDSNSAL